MSNQTIDRDLFINGNRKLESYHSIEETGRSQIRLWRGRAAKPARPIAELSAREEIPRENSLSLFSLSSDILKKVLT